MSVSCECCVLSGRGLCNWLVPRPEESYRVCLTVIVKLRQMRRPKPPRGCRAIEKKWLFQQPIPVTARSKAWVCRHSLAGIVGSNPTGGMDVCLLLCFVR
jgi:hypothetical protein